MLYKEESTCANCGSEVSAEICPYCGHANKSQKVFWGRLQTDIRAPTNVRSWYKNPFWVAVVGSCIIIAGQLFSTYLTIYTSNEAGDFSVSTDRISFSFYKLNNTILPPTEDLLGFYEPNGTACTEAYFGVNINVIDTHPLLRPYNHNVIIKPPSKLPKGIYAYVAWPEGKPSFSRVIDILVTNETSPGIYPITIQAIGGDGKIRSCECYITIHPMVYHINPEYYDLQYAQRHWLLESFNSSYIM